MTPVIIAAADGSALGNPGPAGWAWYVDDGCWASGGWPHATNNQAELTAVLELFRATSHLDDELHVLCDSQYVINAITKWMPGWKRKGWRKGDGKPVMNVELMQQLDAALSGRRYRFEWVKGHVGHALNEAADTRARAVAEAFRRGDAVVPSGPGWTGGGEPAASDAASVSSVDPLVEDRALEDATLFEFDDPAAEWLTLPLELTSEEHTRLVERARAAGMTPEEFLRSLI